MSRTAILRIKMHLIHSFNGEEREGDTGKKKEEDED
jgi:hypothetical protein